MPGCSTFAHKRLSLSGLACLVLIAGCSGSDGDDPGSAFDPIDVATFDPTAEEGGEGTDEDAGGGSPLGLVDLGDFEVESGPETPNGGNGSEGVGEGGMAGLPESLTVLRSLGGARTEQVSGRPVSNRLLTTRLGAQDCISVTQGEPFFLDSTTSFDTTIFVNRCTLPLSLDFVSGTQGAPRRPALWYCVTTGRQNNPACGESTNQASFTPNTFDNATSWTLFRAALNEIRYAVCPPHSFAINPDKTLWLGGPEYACLRLASQADGADSIYVDVDAQLELWYQQSGVTR